MNHEQEKQNTYNVKFWHVRFISSATRTQQCVADLHLAVNYIKLLVFFHGHETMGSPCTALELQNISYSYQRYKCT
jgi:hypothetical protein